MDAYDPVRKVGSGAFAVCYLVRRKDDGRELAIKKLASPINELSAQDLLDVENEVKLLSDLNHPNIVQYFGSFVDCGLQHIVMEYASGGTLQQVIRDASDVCFSEDQVWEWFAQMVLALKYIHDRNILHRDLKSQNILLWGSRKRVVKVADFGIAKVVSISEQNAQNRTGPGACVGTPYYLSPELWRGEPHVPKSDVWALGCVLYELVALRRPFESNTIPSLMLSVINGDVKPLLGESNNFSKQMQEIMYSMLTQEVEQRPTISEVRNRSAVDKQVQRWESICDLIIEDDGILAQIDAERYLDNTESDVVECVEGINQTSISPTDHESHHAITISDTSSVMSTSSKSNLSANALQHTITGSISPRRKATTRDRALLARSSQNRRQLARTFTGTTSHSSKRSTDMSQTYLSNTSSGLGLLSSRREAYRIMYLNRRCFRWGNGQNKPRLEESLLPFDIRSISSCTAMTTSPSVHYLAITGENKLVSWGSNSGGQLGCDGNHSHRYPELVPFFEGGSVLDAASGSEFSIVVSYDGSVYVWGDLSELCGKKAKLKRLSVVRNLDCSASEFDSVAGPGTRGLRKRSSQLTLMSSLESVGEEAAAVGHVTGADPPLPPREVEDDLEETQLTLEESNGSEVHDAWPTWARNSALEQVASEKYNPFAQDSKTLPTAICSEYSTHPSEVCGNTAPNPFGGDAERDAIYSVHEEQQEQQAKSLPIQNSHILHNDSQAAKPSVAIAKNNAQVSSVRLDIPVETNSAKLEVELGLIVNLGARGTGIVRYCGETDFAKGVWVGIELDDPQGKNNGTVQGKQYFLAKESHGLFVRPSAIMLQSDDVKSQIETTVEENSEERKSDNDSDRSLSSLSSSDDNDDDVFDKDDGSEVLTKTQLEDLENCIYRTPMLVQSLKRVKAVMCVCGERFAAILDSQGRLFTWGENDYGQLGLGDDDNRYFPCLVRSIKRKVISTIAAGAEFMLALSSGSTPVIYSWGRGAEGQLGRGDEPLPQGTVDGEVVWEDTVNSEPLAVWDTSSCGGGAGDGSQTSGKVVAISAGLEHAAFVSADGELFTWGRGTSGQLGHGDTISRGVPCKVMGLSRTGEDVHVVTVTCGAQHTVALTDTRTVYSWGSETSGLLGHGAFTHQAGVLSEPKVISALTGHAVESLYSDATCTYAVSAVENPQDGL